MNDVLITVSGTIPPSLEQEIAEGKRPEADYVAMARGFEADLIDYDKARAMTGEIGALLERVAGPNLMLAWACFQLRHRYRVIFTDGEQVGLPFAFFLKYVGGSGHRASHMMIVHILSVRKKTLLLDRLALHTHIETFLVYSSWQQRFIQDRWNLPSERVVFTPFMVDSSFFKTASVQASEPLELRELARPIICAVGLEFRDYPTLLDAVEGLDVRVIIAAASPWSKRTDSTRGRKIPDNVLVRKFTQYELRDVYRASEFLVMPLYDVEFQAGVTAILEAMAMSKAVVCTRTKGQTDVVEDGLTGLYVAPGDATALRAAITRLLTNPDQAERMGAAGRRVVDDRMSLESYVDRLASLVRSSKRRPASFTGAS